MDKLVLAVLGSFFGFILGLVALGVKERLDFRRRVLLFKVTARHLAWGLKTYIHEDPAECKGLDIKPLNSCLDGACRSRSFVKIYELLFSRYMDWARGSYSPQGLKASEIGKVRGELDGVIRQLDTSFSGCEKARISVAQRWRGMVDCWKRQKKGPTGAP